MCIRDSRNPFDKSVKIKKRNIIKFYLPGTDEAKQNLLILRKNSVNLRQDFEGHFDSKLKEGYLSDFWKDIRGGETFFNPIPFEVNVFFPGYFQHWPGGWTNPNDFSGPKSLRYEIRFQT